MTDTNDLLILANSKEDISELELFIKNNYKLPSKLKFNSRSR